jgi:hypothetical protein
MALRIVAISRQGIKGAGRPLIRFALCLGYVIPGGCPVLLHIAAGPWVARYSAVGASRCRWPRAARASMRPSRYDVSKRRISHTMQHRWAAGHACTLVRACVRESRGVACSPFSSPLAWLLPPAYTRELAAHHRVHLQARWLDGAAHLNRCALNCSPRAGLSE